MTDWVKRGAAAAMTKKALNGRGIFPGLGGGQMIGRMQARRGMGCPPGASGAGCAPNAYKPPAAMPTPPSPSGAPAPHLNQPPTPAPAPQPAPQAAPQPPQFSGLPQINIPRQPSPAPNIQGTGPEPVQPAGMDWRHPQFPQAGPQMPEGNHPEMSQRMTPPSTAGIGHPGGGPEAEQPSQPQLDTTETDDITPVEGRPNNEPLDANSGNNRYVQTNYQAPGTQQDEQHHSPAWRSGGIDPATGKNYSPGIIGNPSTSGNSADWEEMMGGKQAPVGRFSDMPEDFKQRFHQFGEQRGLSPEYAQNYYNQHFQGNDQAIAQQRAKLGWGQYAQNSSPNQPQGGALADLPQDFQDRYNKRFQAGMTKATPEEAAQYFEQHYDGNQQAMDQSRANWAKERSQHDGFDAAEDFWSQGSGPGQLQPNQQPAQTVEGQGGAAKPPQPWSDDPESYKWLQERGHLPQTPQPNSLVKANAADYPALAAMHNPFVVAQLAIGRRAARGLLNTLRG